MSERFARLYPGACLPRGAQEAIALRVGALRARHGLGERVLPHRDAGALAMRPRQLLLFGAFSAISR